MNNPTIQRIAVVGAGLMGHGIGQEFAVAGYAVALHDQTNEQLQAARRNIAANLALLGQDAAALDRIRTTTALADAVADADVVIEAVSEDLPLKQQLFRDLDALAPPHSILASNTSSFMPSLLAAATRRPEQLLVAHYFNPPYLLPLVELVPGERTSEQTLETMCALLIEIGKRPAIVRKEVPGFVGNRLQAALMREALAIVEQGIATPQDVDTIIRDGFGRRLAVAGMFEIADLAGLDVWLAVARQLFPAIESSREVPALLAEKGQRGELGVKSGQGFYPWPDEAAAALRQRIGQALIEIARWS